MRDMIRVLILLLLLILPVSSSYGQVLIDYVNRDDGYFSWELLERRDLEDVSILDINLVSQRWKEIIWTHRLIVGVPKDIVNPDVGILFITGSWKGYPSEEVSYIREMARNLGCVSGVLFDVPNQPLFEGLREDALIAHTIARYVETKDEEWLLLLPMTKSAVRAITAIQEVSKREFNIDVKGFLVTGASKRGWTTWLTAVSDSRVKGIAPMVYDNLNITMQFNHQREIWGDFSPELSDYTSLGLDRLSGTPIGERILSIIDPYSYREMLTLPKLIINGSNDPYWAIDAINLYLDDLPKETYILYVPNSGHNLEDRERVVKGISAFYLYIAGRIPFPEISYELSKDDDSVTLTLQSSIKPTRAGLWYAESEDKNFVHSTWRYIEGKESRDGYTMRIKRDKDRELAVFGELYYKIGDIEFYLCTPAKIVL